MHGIMGSVTRGMFQQLFAVIAELMSMALRRAAELSQNLARQGCASRVRERSLTCSARTCLLRDSG